MIIAVDGLAAKARNDMGVYIKDMKMPKECTHCRFTYKYEHPEAGDYEICQFIDEPIPQAGIDNRCPLIEVKEPHGRLIDEIDIDLFDPSLGTNEYINDLMAMHNIDYVNGDDEDKVRAFALDLRHSCMNVIKTAPTIIDAESEE